VALGLRQLRYFIAIADAGVLSRAAETLNVAQSALSHHVAALETVRSASASAIPLSRWSPSMS
jgi:hypothetical protein